MRVLLVSTYDLGRQPFGLASPAAWLREAGVDVRCADLSRSRIEDETLATTDMAGFYLPMHTATRLALPLIARARRLNPALTLCAFGLYAVLNEAALRAAGVQAVFGGEFEQQLTEWVLEKAAGRTAKRDAESRMPNGRSAPSDGRRHELSRLTFKVPDRSGLPGLDRYAALQSADGDRRLVGYTEASRGCKHLCRHCPIVPVYEGRFRVVSPEVVIEDIRRQVAAGARHITFGDPDFFNGIRHARALMEAFAREFEGITYDATIKIEHLLKHRDALPLLARTGCLFVTSAVESVDDDVLDKLQKGHTRADFERAAAACREAELALAPTFLPFTPWTSLEGYIELLKTIASLELVDQVAPIQLAIRLLVPNGSRLMELDEIRGTVGPFDPCALVFPWAHADPRVDGLQKEVEQVVSARGRAPRHEVFARVWGLAHEAAGAHAPVPTLPSRATIPFLTEPWYC